MKIFLLILLMFYAQFCFGLGVNINGNIEILGGYNSDDDFNKNTHEDEFYHAQNLILDSYIDVTGRIKVSIGFQLNNYGGNEGNPNSSFAPHRFNMRNGYIQFSEHDERHIRIGHQKISLPSATFGNPYFNGYAAAISSKKKFNETYTVNLLILHPLTKANGKIKKQNAILFGGYVDISNSFLDISPYLTYSRIDHDVDSIFNWASAPDDGYSYVTAGGFAMKMYPRYDVIIKLDAMHADSNNTGSHHYESKGSHLVFAAEYMNDYVAPEIFGWYSTGNGKSLVQHHDYGLVPVVDDEYGFSPTRYGFKGSNSIGKDSALSSSGIGTTGIGVNFKNIRLTDKKIYHSIYGAYVRGTSTHQGNGAPPAVSVNGYVKKEQGIMTNRDYAVETGIGSRISITDKVDLLLDISYIFSGFADEKYSDDIFNAELVVKYYFK